MASIIVPIPNTDRTVTRPVSITILIQLLKITNLNPAEFRTRMVGVADAEKVQHGYLKDTEPDEEDDKTTTTSSPHEDKIDIKPNRLSTDRKLTLEVEDEIVGDLTTPVRYNDHKPVFIDDKLNIRIKPVYSDIQTKISVILNTRDKVEASNWLQTIKARLYRSAVSQGHSIDYSYIIPHSIMKSLYDIHLRKEHLAGYGEEYGQYIARCFDNRYDILTNVSGTNHVCVIKEKQVHVLGYFDFDFEPEKPEKEDDKAGGWNIRFTYTIRYQRPDNLVFEYPLMVHQSLVPDGMIIKDKPEHESTYPVFRGLTAHYFHQMATLENKYNRIVYEGIPEPTYDDWITEWSPGDYIQLCKIMLQVDENELKWVVDIPDMTETFEFKESVLRWFRQRGQKILTHRKDPFYFTLHDDTNKLPDSLLTISDELRINSVEDLNLRKMYHMCVWVVYNFGELDDDSFRDLIANCDLLHEWLEAIAPGTGAEKIRCNLDNTINVEDFKKWYLENGGEDRFGPLPNGPGLPWSECVGSYCRIKNDWKSKSDGTSILNGNDRLTDYKTTGAYAIIAKRQRED